MKQSTILGLVLAAAAVAIVGLILFFTLKTDSSTKSVSPVPKPINETGTVAAIDNRTNADNKTSTTTPTSTTTEDTTEIAGIVSTNETTSTVRDTSQDKSLLNSLVIAQLHDSNRKQNDSATQTTTETPTTKSTSSTKITKKPDDDILLQNIADVINKLTGAETVYLKTKLIEIANLLKEGTNTITSQTKKVLKDAKNNAVTLKNNVGKYILDLTLQSEVKKVLTDASARFDEMINKISSSD